MVNWKNEEGEDDKTDKSYSVESSSDSEKGLLPASKWQYLNLKDTNIFYNDKPEPLKEFMQNVKTDITMEFPNFEKNCWKVLASYHREFAEFDTICKRFSEQSFMADVKTNIERAGRVDTDLDHTSL